MRFAPFLFVVLSLLSSSVFGRENHWTEDKPAGNPNHGMKPDKKRTFDYHTERLNKLEEKHEARRAELGMKKGYDGKQNKGARTEY